MARSVEQIDIDRIFLYEENPRHEAIESQDEIIEYLCKDEQIFALARSISDKGTNPLELVGAVQIPGSGKNSTKKNYEVWEGNRRICAIKLLNDPDLAPPHLRKDFQKLTSGYKPIKRISGIVFDDHAELKFWMDIIHGGQQGGIGRKDWNAEQKERHTGSGRNKVAQVVLDTAEGLGLISKEDRSGKITTAQRFLNSPLVKDALGIDTSNPNDITYTRPLEDFQKQLGRFIEDLKENRKVTSRHNKEQIDEYGRRLSQNTELSGERISPLSISRALKQTSTQRRKAPKKPRKQVHLGHNKSLDQALTGLGNNKLESLYYSVCAISLETHTPLITIGIWAFVECLSALAGRNESTDFYSFYSSHRLEEMGFTSKSHRNGIREALDRIQKHGNFTKHHQNSGMFDGKQLANDVETITPLLIKTVEIAAGKK